MLKSVGIDIGTSSIKVLEIVASNKGLALHRFTDHPLSTNLNHDTELDIIEFLRKLASEYDPNNTVFSVALRQDQVATRYKNFPFRERQKILKSLPFELEEDLPMNPETAVYDAKILQYRGASAEVLACAASKEAVGNLVKLCADALIEPSLISCEGAALANWKENWTQAPPAIEGAALIDTSVLSKTVVIQMNLGHTHTVVNALEDGRLISSRTIYWGGKQIAEAIAKRYEISYEAALRELQLKGFILTSKGSASADQITFSDTISGAFKDLLKELRLYLLEIRSDFNAYINSIEI
ncbi:MAG: pilus assembly protein PilM, partial [Pseudobdellovibrionaceae bacterium]